VQGYLVLIILKTLKKLVKIYKIQNGKKWNKKRNKLMIIFNKKLINIWNKNKMKKKDEKYKNNFKKSYLYYRLNIN
jgi:hypothetical protein